MGFEVSKRYLKFAFLKHLSWPCDIFNYSSNWNHFKNCDSEPTDIVPVKFSQHPVIDLREVVFKEIAEDAR